MPLLIWLLSTLVAGLIGYGAVVTRISVLELKVAIEAADIAEIKADVKELLRKWR